MKIDNSMDLYNVSETASEDLGQEHVVLRRNKFAGFFDKVSSWILVVMLFLLPLFASTNVGVNDEVIKRSLAIVAIVVAFFLWLLARLEDGKFRIPRNPILWSSGLILIVSFLATIFSPVIMESLIGVGVETGTFVSISMGIILMILISIYAQNPKVLSRIFSAIVASMLVLFLVQLVHNIFGLTFFGLLTNTISSLVGKWNDFAFFSGFAVLLSVAVLEIMSVRGRPRIVATILGILGLIGLYFTNFFTAIVLVALLSLLMFAYKFSFSERHISGSLVPTSNSLKSYSFALFIISIIFLVFSGFTDSKVIAKLNLGNLEVRPSWSSTYEISNSAISKNPFIGSGLNRFNRVWLQNKPVGVNDTIFWSSDFNAGVGLIPTFATTSGIVGIVAWILFLASILYLGFISLFKTRCDNSDHAFRFVIFLGTLYLWIVCFFYIPDTVLWLLTFVLTGIFVASNVKIDSLGNEEVDLSKNPKASFVSVLIIILLILGTLISSYFLFARYRSLYAYEKAVHAYSLSGNAEDAKKNILRAIEIDGSQDIYYRSLADAYLLELNSLLSNSESTDSTDVLKSKFQSILSEAISAGDKATKLNGTNYQNWMSLAKVYSSVVPLKIQGADTLAEKSYANALLEYPQNPQVYMNLARLQIAKGDKKSARKFISDALKLKGNYTEALFTLAQLDYSEGNIKSAIKNTEQTAILAPADIGVFFQLGFLKYLNRDYGGAVIALERARELNPNYSNAKYFLGLSYNVLGKNKLAIKEFEDILSLNPLNSEVKTILSNLRSGRNALDGVGSPADTPDLRDSLPVKEGVRASSTR